MQSLAFKVLFRKKGTASAIIAVAFLIAILSSTSALVNNLNAETSLFASLPPIGQTYLVTSVGSNSLTDSWVDWNLINLFEGRSGVSYACSQQILSVRIQTETGVYSINLRAVDDVAAFLKNRHASVSGKVGLGASEAVVGIVLSNMASLGRADDLILFLNNQQIPLNVTAVVRMNDQSDSELILSLDSLQNITQVPAKVSFVEFSIDGSGQASKVLDDLVEILPSDVKIVGVQQTIAFAKDINNQTVNFISVWSVAVYAVIMGASYVIALRVLNDAKYELFMLRFFGTKKNGIVTLILVYTLVLAFLGSVIGLAIGLVGTQVISTGIRWFLGNSLLAPFLEPIQALQILLLTGVFSFLGAIYPAVRATQSMVEEVSL